MSIKSQTQACPAQTAETLTLRNGMRIRLRNIGADDRDAFATLFSRLSPESRHRRFHSSKPRLTPREISFFTDVDQHEHAAIAAVDDRDGSIVAVGRYVADPDAGIAIAEMAVEVADELQGMGIGTALASSTVERARANGYSTLTAVTLWDNPPARALLRRLHFRAHSTDGSRIELQLDLGDLTTRMLT